MERARDLAKELEQQGVGRVLDQFENYLHFLDNAPGKLPWDMAEHDDLLHPADKPDSE